LGRGGGFLPPGYAQKDTLEDIFGVRRAAGNPVRRAKDALMMPLKKIFQTV
jgi:hypothetical protein